MPSFYRLGARLETRQGQRQKAKRKAGIDFVDPCLMLGLPGVSSEILRAALGLPGVYSEILRAALGLSYVSSEILRAALRMTAHLRLAVISWF